MQSPRTLARWAGILYIVTVITSIPALALKEPILTDSALLETDSPLLLLAALLEIVLAFACVGTAVCLYPLVARTSTAGALGFVAARTLEAGLIFSGVLAMLTLIPVHRTGTVADGPIDAVLVGIHDWAFLLGPGTIPAVNALLLATMLFRARLVPRIIPLVGLIGAPLLLASATATLFGLLDQVSPLSGLLALPIALWEISLGLWLTFRGVTVEESARTVD